jgi:GTP-binding protein
MTNRCKGKKGDDLILYVPEGTIIKEDGKVVADLTRDGQQIILVEGGNGGWGNQHFKSSIKQAPEWAKEGLPGGKKILDLELRLIADVAIIGLPNAGKSTLLSVVSNARPKIADYPFTTLAPNLGVVKVGEREFIIADIPGLIEGAHLGKGLGLDFLRHIKRTRLLVHLIPADSPDYLADYETIRAEMKSFDRSLLKKPEIVVVSKAEIIPEEVVKKQIKKLQKKIKDETILIISAASSTNVSALIFEIAKRLG